MLRPVAVMLLASFHFRGWFSRVYIAWKYKEKVALRLKKSQFSWYTFLLIFESFIPVAPTPGTVST